MTQPDNETSLAAGLVAALVSAKKTVAIAESCTGGWVAKVLTDVAGSSACFGYGVASYSNAAKERLLGVRQDTLEQHGAVSEQTVAEMARGVLELSDADFGVAVSGIAGPGGGSAEKPVGTVWFGWSTNAPEGIRVHTRLAQLAGDREAVRRASVRIALEGLHNSLREAHV